MRCSPVELLPKVGSADFRKAGAEMRLAVPLFSALFLSVSTTQADDFGLDDVKGWLDGCVALAPAASPVTSVVELDCLKAAIEYCEVGRSKEYHQPCYSSLASSLSAEVRLIRPFLELTEETSVRTRRSYERRLERIDKSDHESCAEEAPKAECELVEIGLKWLEARSLARVVEVSFQQVIDEERAED